MAQQIPMRARTGYRLVKLAELLLALGDQTLAPLGVRTKHIHVLETLIADETLSQQDVSRSMGIDPNVLVGVLDELESQGLAERRRNPQDRRRHVILVTDAGRALAAESARLLDAAESDFLAAVSAADRKVLHSATDKLLTAHKPNWASDDC
ncbi:MarR family winged helix-turn-helix transcriptional regulator [Yinghuangia soli]|uniref:MarR family winged helix-turn-helix transcriptional regulator n=1 Tax=Yinghuangia soli TaxID=2908204 RepID=A0AA41U819_9ACTN|nr:MarR family winged helix-turn-helix transcriptional regulator [Yinghuangia soli]MCF2532469.1 MarR family winged helix-turn-helix transcriptional regulator [Yinghuangia soli]